MVRLADRSEHFWIKGNELGPTLTLDYNKFPFHNEVKAQPVDRVFVVSKPGNFPNCHVHVFTDANMTMEHHLDLINIDPDAIYGPWVFEVYTRVT